MARFGEPDLTGKASVVADEDGVIIWTRPDGLVVTKGDRSYAHVIAYVAFYLAHALSGQQAPSPFDMLFGAVKVSA